MQHYLCLGGLTVRNFATRLRELNNYLPYCPREEGKAEPSKLSDDNLIQILRQSLKNVSRLFLVRTLNFISSIFKALLTILRNSKSDRHSKRNVTRSKRPDNPEFKNKGNWNKSENKQPTSKPQSSKYKKCAHCSCTNHATKDCWFSPKNKGKTKPGKKNVSATDKNVLMTQEQFNAILERLPRNPKSGKRKVCDFTPEDSDAEIVEMFSPKMVQICTAQHVQNKKKRFFN